MKTQKFNRKTFQVDAVRVTKENMSAVAKWCQGEIQTGNDGKKFIKVRVLRPLNEGQTKAYPGDWVLYAGTGYKVYTNKSFWTCFEKPQPKEGRRSRKGHPGGPVVVDESQRVKAFVSPVVENEIPRLTEDVRIALTKAKRDAYAHRRLEGGGI